MSRAEEIADGIYVSKHGAANGKMNQAISLFQHCNVNPSEVYLNAANVDEENDG